ncbi:phosphatase phospho-type [Trametes maxima]|nr:phosphatase phospho-type [Trametes maxima]
MSLPPVERQLIVFDFDWSLADQDSDRWVFEVLAPKLRKKMKELKKEVQWTDLVAQSLKELFDLGGKREEIEDALRIMPFHPAMIRGTSALKSRGKTTFFCLSNANIIFITTILKSKGLENLFDEIITNPAEWDPSGLLKLRRRVDPAGPQHECKVGCSPNMCKGDELTAFLERHQPEFDRIVYVGDGSNDLCPVLRLRKQDVVFCRRFRGLYNLIKPYEEEGRLRCQVQYWTGAWEAEALLDRL